MMKIVYLREDGWEGGSEGGRGDYRLGHSDINTKSVSET